MTTRARPFPALQALWGLLKTYAWGEIKQQPWRTLSVVITIALGVALALGVHLINHSALSAFAQASNTAQGEPDWQVYSRSEQPIPFDIWNQLSQQREISAMAPAVSQTIRMRGTTPDEPVIPLQLIGMDTVAQASFNPTRLPQNFPQTDRLAVFAPDSVYLNEAALKRWTEPPATIEVWTNQQWLRLHVRGRVDQPGPPTAVMDIAAAQAVLGLQDALHRIDLRVAPELTQQSAAALQQRWRLPPELVLQAPAQRGNQLARMTQAYRVNLTVLALVALFTGTFLVFAALSLSITKRLSQFALLGILGLSRRERMQLVLSEAAVLGLLGSALGVVLAAGLATVALRTLGGDLGSGFFSGERTLLQWDLTATGVFMALGLIATLLGAWWPAQRAANLQPALAIKGLSVHQATRPHRQVVTGLVVLLSAAVLCQLDPIADMPLGAYVGIALLLLGALITLPPSVSWLLAQTPQRWLSRHLPLLAISRAQRMPHTGATAISGIVASLALAVALTVMVGSFRFSVSQWLDTVLPADVYLRTSAPGGNDVTPVFDAALVDQLRTLPGVSGVRGQRITEIILDPNLAPVTLLARELPRGPDGHPSDTPLVDTVVDLAALTTATSYPVWISEALRDRLALRLGDAIPSLATALPGQTPRVAGIWRDYARQSGSLVMAHTDYVAQTGDARFTDLGLTFTDDQRRNADQSAVIADIRAAVTAAAGEAIAADLSITQSMQIRAASLTIFDRSFAITRWLQLVAIGIGLFGVASSFSAQVLSRQREFGMLMHLGYTRGQLSAMVTAEGFIWSLIGGLVGAALGLVVSAVLVFVVNPQSFHWTMDWQIPWGDVALMVLAVMASGTGTCWLIARQTLRQSMVQSVKQDW